MTPRRTTTDVNLDPTFRYLSVPAVARALGVSTRSVIRWILTGKLPAVRLGGAGPSGYYRIARSDLDQWLQARRVKLVGAAVEGP